MSADQFHAEVMSELERIEVTEAFPPIPTTAFDYRATRSGYEPGDPIGYGPTKEHAVQNLKDEEANLREFLQEADAKREMRALEVAQEMKQSRDEEFIEALEAKFPMLLGWPGKKEKQ